MTKTRLNNSLYAALLLGSGLALSGCATLPDDLFSDLGSSIPVPPPPPPANATVGAAAQPTLGSNPPPAVTVADVARVENSTSDETLAFRMVQDARTVSLGTDPKSTSSDSATNLGGATVFVDIPADPDPDADPTLRLTLGNPALGVSNVTLQLDPSETFYQATLADGRIVTLALDTVNSNSAAGGGEFVWTNYGSWGIRSSANVPLAGSQVVLGIETADAAIPSSGSATFTGFVKGTVTIADGANLRVAGLIGDATITADFAAGTLSGGAPSIMAIPIGNLPVPPGTSPGPSQAWNGLSFTGTFATGVNGFTGTTGVTSAPGNSYSLLSSATGFLAGRFYGPGAEEIGAVWNVSDANGSAHGVLVGGR
jgi:hypothetical protein